MAGEAAFAADLDLFASDLHFNRGGTFDVTQQCSHKQRTDHKLFEIRTCQEVFPPMSGTAKVSMTFGSRLEVKRH